MASCSEISSEKQRGGGGAAVKDGCIILVTTVLSLLPPLSLLLLGRLSVARYFLSVHSNDTVPFLISLLLQSKTTTIFSLLVSAVAIAALIQALTGKKPYFLISKRRRLYEACILLFLVQLCLILGFDGTVVGADVNICSVGNLVSPRRLVFVLGLHEMMVFWRRTVAKPVVDEAVLGFSDGSFSWGEKAVLAVALGCLWWRRLRAEVEALAVLPRIRAELEMDVEAADIVGWLLYYLTAAIGGVKLIKGFCWAVKVSANHLIDQNSVAKQSIIWAVRRIVGLISQLPVFCDISN